MEKDQIFVLKDRGVIYINGADSENFLQNIITNDVSKVNNTFSCFSSLLSPQGKYLFDFKVFAVLRRALYVALSSSTGSITVNMMGQKMVRSTLLYFLFFFLDG